MSRIDAHSLAAYVGGLQQSVAKIDSLAESMPRMFVHEEHRLLMRAETDSLLAQARDGVELLRGTEYELGAVAALENAGRAIESLGRPTRGNARSLAQALHTTVDTLADDVTSTRRYLWNGRITGAAESLASARAELVAAIDTLLTPSEQLDPGSVAVVGDALGSTTWQIPGPHLETTRPAEALLAAAVDDPRAAHDLRRVLGTWRAALVDDYEPGPALADRARTIIARGADDMTSDDWIELQRLVDADPAGAFVRVPREVPVSGLRVDDVLFDASRRAPDGDAPWEQHVLVESTALGLERADTDLGILRREARALLKQDPTEFGERQWARLAELARLDPRRRVLPNSDSVTVRAALADVADYEARTGHPRELVPRGRGWQGEDAIALADLWNSHVFGIGSRMRLHLADGGVNALLRGAGRIEAGLGEAIETGIPVDGTDAQFFRAIAGRVGLSIGRGIGKGVRNTFEAVTAPAITGQQVARALEGGEIPARLSVAALRRTREWREASHLAQVSVLARMVARQEPTTMAQSREFIANVRRVPIDESLLSPQARRTWREARALVDEEDRSLRAVGEFREGYAGHLDYASVGRLKSTLELIGTEFAIRAKRESTEAATTAAAAPPAAPVEEVQWRLVDATGAPEASMLDAGAALDERLVW